MVTCINTIVNCLRNGPSDHFLQSVHNLKDSILFVGTYENYFLISGSLFSNRPCLYTFLLPTGLSSKQEGLGRNSHVGTVWIQISGTPLNCITCWCRPYYVYLHRTVSGDFQTWIIFKLGKNQRCAPGFEPGPTIRGWSQLERPNHMSAALYFITRKRS